MQHGILSKTGIVPVTCWLVQKYLCSPVGIVSKQRNPEPALQVPFPRSGMRNKLHRHTAHVSIMVDSIIPLNYKEIIPIFCFFCW